MTNPEKIAGLAFGLLVGLGCLSVSLEWPAPAVWTWLALVIAEGAWLLVLWMKPEGQ